MINQIYRKNRPQIWKKIKKVIFIKIEKKLRDKKLSSSLTFFKTNRFLTNYYPKELQKKIENDNFKFILFEIK